MARGSIKAYGGGSGAGNPAGSHRLGYASMTGQNGTGGLIILYVKGKIIINGSIQSNGSNGGNGEYGNNTRCWSCPGAGSGGGSIHLFYGKEIEGKNKISVAGGSQGYVAIWNQSTAGGNGSINIEKIKI